MSGRHSRCVSSGLSSALFVLASIVAMSASSAWANQASMSPPATPSPFGYAAVHPPSQTAPVPVSPTGNVVARLMTTRISIEETVTLTVTAIDVDGEIDTSALEQSFDLVGRSRSSQVEVVNGVRRDTRSWALELSPRSVGVFTVPAVSVGGVDSDLQTLEVTEPLTGADRVLFVEVEVDTREPWVQSQVLLTLRVFDSVGILEGAVSEPAGKDLVVQRLDDDRTSTVERAGRRYTVTERRFAVFPQSSGSLLVEPIVLNATVPTQPSRVRGFFAPSKRVTRRSAPITLEVRARPPGQPGWWLPAIALQLQGEWLSSGQAGNAVPNGQAPSQVGAGPIEATVGVPLTRALTVRALGVLESQLPVLPVPEVDGASLYADAPSVKSSIRSQGIETEQRLSWAVIPERVGLLELPAISLDWFDTASGTTRTATLPAARLNIRAGTGTPVTAGPPSPNATGGATGGGAISGAGGSTPLSQDAPINGVDLDEPAPSRLAPSVVALEASASNWRLLAMLAVLAWLVTAILWLVSARRSRRVQEPSSTTARSDGALTVSRALAALRRAEQPRAFADAALKWGRARWPEDPPASLTALAERLADTPAATTLRRLDASLYGSPADAAQDQGNSFRRLADELEATDRSQPPHGTSTVSRLPAL